VKEGLGLHPTVKHLCVVSPSEDFRLTIALLFWKKYEISLCEDWESLLTVADNYGNTIAIVDTTLCTSIPQIVRASRSLAFTRSRVHILRIYPYQLEDEKIEDWLILRVDWITSRLANADPDRPPDIVKSVYRLLAGTDSNPKE
jgi:hypothetical protein